VRLVGHTFVTHSPLFSKVLLADPFGLRKITTISHNLAHAYVVCPDDRYQKLKIYILELILDSYEYTSVS